MIPHIGDPDYVFLYLYILDLGCYDTQKKYILWVYWSCYNYQNYSL